MKNVFLLVMSLLSLTAFAANEGPHGTPAFEPYVVAEKVMSPGFFAPPHMRFERGVRIYSDGQVMAMEGGVNRSLSRLSWRKLRQLNAQVEAINESELIDLNAGEPRCEDAPSTRYTVRKSSAAVELEIAAWEGCHDFALRGGAGQVVKAFLDKIEEQARRN
ncbi:MAG: hypothetical protein NDJ90_10640 [Oligoflexia bacterium]|nr:hypothetical protein [Oligoflexia bacterium]